MRQFFKYLPILSVLIFSGCAKQTSPSGGPKDEAPPKLKLATPDNQTTNFIADEITLEFDEYIQINNPREQVLITPNIGKNYELIVKKNKATLKLNAKLEDSTTYTINFREAIQDITEKNAAKDLKYSFSTGSYIDSLSISGTVTNILQGVPAKDYTVALVAQSDTFNIFKHPAQWFSITDKDGTFKIENLKPANYILYAIEDKNKNLIVDSKSEPYGYLAEVIRLNHTLDSIKISTTKLDARELKIISARPITDYFNIKTTKSITNYTIQPLDTAITLYSKKMDDDANIKIYNSIKLQDSLAIKFTATDSISNSIDTVLYVKFDPRPTLLKEKLTAKIQQLNYYSNLKELEGSILFNKPIITMNPDSIFIELDSLNKIYFDPSELEWTQDQTQLTIKKKLEDPIVKKTQQNKSRIEQSSAPIDSLKKTIINKLFINESAFISVEMDSVQKTNESIKIITPEESGVIIAEVKSSEKFILQLLNDKFKIINEVANNPTVKFENLTPGSYQLRLIIDKNNNGKWDPGNYYTNKEPENIIFYKNEKSEKLISLKANWELGPLLITYE